MTTGVDKLVTGYHRYRDGPYEQSRQLIEALVAHGQRPEVAVVACSDSRVDPAILFQADPGDLFVIRNVANLVPPMEKEGTYHGTSAALEYAVLGLGVKHMVVLGHAHCGGIKAMMAPDTSDDPYTFVPSWVSMLDAAHRRVLATMAQASEEARTRACEQNAVLGLGVKHLMVLGHAHCGGIKAMMVPDQGDNTFTFVPSWVSMLAAAHRRVLATMAQAGDEARTRACEQNAVLVSLENLTTFPWVQARVQSGDLQLHGWYIDIAAPELSSYDWEAGKFTPLA